MIVAGPRAVLEECPFGVETTPEGVSQAAR
jgi:hypothetical protein